MGEITVKESSQNQKPVKRKHIWWRVLLAWLGGFIFFPLLVAGSAALLGMAFTVEQTVSMFGGNPEELIGENYRKDTLLNMIMKLTQKQFNSIADFDEISPIFQKYFDEYVNTALNDYAHYQLDWEELKTRPFQGGTSENPDLFTYLQQDLTEGIKVANLIPDVDNLTTVFKYFLYDVMRDSENNIIYDEHNNVILNTEDPFSIADLISGEGGITTVINNIFDYIKVEDIIDDISPTDSLMNAIRYWKISDFNGENIKSLKIADIYGDNPSSDLMRALVENDISIADLDDTSTLLSLKLGDIISITDENSLLYTFKDKTLEEITNINIEDLYLKDILSESIYVDKGDGKYNGVIAAIMENERYGRYITSSYSGTYAEWKAEDPENEMFKATVGTLTDFDSINQLKLGDVMSITDEDSLLYSFREKTLAEIADLDINDMLLTDLLSESVYVDKGDGKYNRIIAAVMENERKARYAAAYALDPTIGDYDSWKATNPENAKFKATVATLTNYSSISQLKLGDVMSITDPDSLLYTFREETLESISSLNVEDMLLKDFLNESIYVDKGDGKYNKVIAAVMENERKGRYDAAYALDPTIGDYDSWKAADPENAKFQATVGTLMDYSSISNLKLSDVLEESSYSSSKILSALVDKGATVSTLGDAVSTLTVEEALDIEEGSLLDDPEIRACPISNAALLVEKIKAKATLSKVVTVTDSSPKIIKTLTDYQGIDPVTGKAVFGENDARLSEIEDIVINLKLGETVEITSNSHPIMQALSDTYVFATYGPTDPKYYLTMDYKMDHLNFNEVFTYEQVEDNILLKSLWDNNNDGEFYITDIATAMSNVPLTDMVGDDMYLDGEDRIIGGVTYKKIDPSWWYLLTEEGESFTEEEEYYVIKNGKNYGLSDMSQLVTNMRYHMETESVLKLYDAGFISISSTNIPKLEMLAVDNDHDGIYEPEDGDKRYGDLSMTEFVNAAFSFLH